MRALRPLAVSLALLAGSAVPAVSLAADPPAGAGPLDAMDALEGAEWSFSISAYGFVVPDARDYVNPNVTADRGALHLEARYNYEAYEAGSAWIGWKLAAGEELALELTPMVGGVFGSISGIAPGWLLTLDWRRLSLYSQGEYFLDASDAAGNFFFTWSELSYAPLEWLRAGLAVMRTKAFETSLDVQRGLVVGVSYRSVELDGYVFNLGWTDPTFVFAVVAGF